MTGSRRTAARIARLRSRLQKLVGAMSWAQKRIILVGLDTVMLSFAVWLAFSIRLGTWIMPTTHQLTAILLAPAIAVPFFIRMGLYRAVIRYLPERAFWTIARAVLFATFAWIGAIFLFEIARMTLIPRSVTLIYGLLAIAFVAGSRFAIKYALHAQRPSGRSKDNLILYGAGQTGAVLVDALRRERAATVVGFVDDNPKLFERDVSGVRVYPSSQISTLMDETGTSEVVLCMPSISSSRRAEIVGRLTDLNARVRVVPAVSDLATGRFIISQMREIDIDDLLGRSAVPADQALMRSVIENRSILVTGGGGSIGSELCRLFIEWQPRELIILEQSEFALYQIDRQLRQATDVRILPVLGSVADKALVERLFREHAVQMVFHAAAHKHVPMVEANSLEGIRNNVFGTANIAEHALRAGVEHFVLISTDKAVRPTNVMGATKRAAEMIVRDCAERAVASGRNQKFAAVRFGNVLGSNGSVVPLFKEQIAAGGPITLTDDRMTRYFMSIHEAAELIVQASGYSQGGDIFVLDMGEPVRIRALAEQMIRLAGLTVCDDSHPDGDIEIVTVGTRPGEKLYEELFYDLQAVVPTAQPKIMRTTSFDGARTNIEADLERIEAALAAQDAPAARQALFDMIDEDQAHGRDENAKVVTLASVRNS